ncbi:hypothetical protein [Pseudomonas violetae]|uniref:Uncharacterized protein n=1 Tax=Pseudomonas violetae TaxID=2915813 RepID=A0ABT0EVA9_9PSED|nr:hypothetical protein [Pseudomonas violetae]MCK1789666.1 hypothetical protein [Pseudomonas violetae]
MSTTPTEPTEPTEIPEMMRLLQKHGDLFDKYFSEDLDEQSAVLKAHLLIEGVIRDFSYRSVRNPQHLRGSRLNFHQIVALARSLIFFTTPGLDCYWGMIDQLNKLRNLMAHELEPDQAKFDKCRKALMSLSGSDTLNGSLSFLCGGMNSLLTVSLELQKRERLSEAEREALGLQTS